MKEAETGRPKRTRPNGLKAETYRNHHTEGELMSVHWNDTLVRCMCSCGHTHTTSIFVRKRREVIPRQSNSSVFIIIMMESPLNSAHQQGRKADQMMKSGKHEEAIICHKRAAEFILEAMQQTQSVHALQSLQLQHENHIKQQDLIRKKQQQAEAVKFQCRCRENSVSQGSQTDNGHPNVLTVSATDHITGELNNLRINTALEETDSLLAYLSKRDKLNKTNTDTNHSKRTLVATKTPKGHKTVIEELETQNEELRKHTLLLVKGLDDCKRENQRLRERIEKYESTSENVFNLGPVSANTCMPVMDLPPLEMPNLDLDALKEELHSEHDY